MERLTIKNNDGSYSQPTHTTFNKLFEKLSKLEDVLEKYGIESIGHLDSIINSIRTNTLIDIENKEILELENANLKSELAELKQKAIVPKFVVGQEIWDKYLMAWKIKRVETHQFDKGNGNTAIIEIYRLGHDGNDDYSCCILPSDNDIFFDTKEEAEQKFNELKGE